MFQNLTKEFQRIFKTLKGQGKLSEKNVEDAVRQIKMSLLAGDVNVSVVKDFISHVKSKAMGAKVLESLTPSQQFTKIVHNELVNLMGEAEELDLSFRPPVVIMLVGLQGSGKTTTAAKLANYLRDKGKKSYLVPADLKRPAAVEQLNALGRQLNMEVHPSKSGDNPVKVVKAAVKDAAKMGFDTVIIDTAGRLHIDSEMMTEVKKTAEAARPHHILYIADAMTGQDAVKSAKVFAESLELTGIILTKLDGDARGGSALSVRKVSGKPIYYVGIGEKISDFEKFVPERMASRILGMGDVLSFIETATKNIDREEADNIAKKAMKSRLTLEDLKDQFKSIKKMGSMGKLLGMLPISSKIKNAMNEGTLDKELKRKEAIINSMTVRERRYPKILNGSRRKRIADGSGTEIREVNKLLKEFDAMQKMMKKMKKGGARNMMNMFR